MGLDRLARSHGGGPSAVRQRGRPCGSPPSIVETNRDYCPTCARLASCCLEDGELARPERGQVFLRSDNSSSDHDFIHPELAAHDGVREALAALGIEILNPAGELRAALQAAPTGAAWSKVWRLTREVDLDNALLIFSEELSGPLTNSVFAQMKSGKWRPLAQCFLAGEVIPRDCDHGRRLSRQSGLPCAGSSAAGAVRCGGDAEAGARPARRAMARRRTRRKRVVRTDRGCKGARPLPEKVVVTGPPVPWPLELMPVLSVHGRAALTQKIIDLACHERWKVMHTAALGSRSKPSPIRPRSESLSTAPSLRPSGQPSTQSASTRPPTCRTAFPKAAVSEPWATALKLPMDCADWTSEYWDVFIRDTEQRRPESLATVYPIAARSGLRAPDRLLAFRSDGATTRSAPDETAVTDDPETFASLLLAGITSLRTESPEDSADLVEKWGLADGRDMLREETVAHPDSEPTLLIDRFPPLRHLRP